MKEISILAGGKAGDDIRSAGYVIVRFQDRFGQVAILACDSR
jgi:hypothetical protein